LEEFLNKVLEDTTTDYKNSAGRKTLKNLSSLQEQLKVALLQSGPELIDDKRAMLIKKLKM
jgi:hypothetical protein